MCRTRETAYAQNQTTSSIKHGGGSVTTWSLVDANETSSYAHIL